MAQVALRYTREAFESLDPSLRREHAQFLQRHAASLVTFGPFESEDRAATGYAYQTDFPGFETHGMQTFLAEDPLAAAGLYTTEIVRGWKCALPLRQPQAPRRAGTQGFFFYGTGKSNMTQKRNNIVDAHRAHLQRVDASNCLSRGPLTDPTGTEWFGSAMVYEFADRQALDDFFRDEPYCTNALYERIEIYHWRRGDLAV